MFRSLRQLGILKTTTTIATLFMLAILVFLPGLTPFARAVEPENIITYQGRLLNAVGVPVSDATADMEFYLFDQSTDTCLWSNDDSACATTDTVTVDLADGLFTVYLGDGADTAVIPTSVFADYEDVYLEVVVNGETLAPRKQITAAAYAVNSQTLDGLDSTDILQNTGGSAFGNYDFTGAVFDGASPLVFDGATPGGNTTTITVTDPTGVNAVTFQDGSGTVAFLSDIAGLSFDLDEVYDNDADKQLDVDNAAGLTFDLTTTGDFIIEDAGVAFLTVADDRAFSYATDQTTTDGATLTGLSLTDGDLLSLVGGNFTNDTGRALFIDVTEASETADIVLVQTDFSAADNDVLRIEADGEVFSDVGFTAAGNTNYTDTLIFSGTTLDIFADGTLTLESGTSDIFIPAGDDLSLSAPDELNISSANFEMDGTTGNIATVGDLAVNGDDITSDDTLTLDSSGTVQLGTDDDFLPQLGAGDADLGAVGTPWDNIYGLAGNFSGTLTASDVACTDCLDFTEFEDSLDLDASTSITMNGAEDLTFTNAGSGNLRINLASTGNFFLSTSGGSDFGMFDTGELEYLNGSGTTGTLTRFEYDELTSGTAFEIISGSSSTSGNLLLVSMPFTSSGDLIELTSSSATSTARAINIDFDNGNNNNNVFVLTTDETTNSGTGVDTIKMRITASGEVLSDVGFAAGGASTTYRDGIITHTAGTDFTVTPGGASDDLVIATSNLKVGNGVPELTLDGEDSYVEGSLEVDGSVRFDGLVWMNSSVAYGADVFMNFTTVTGNSENLDINQAHAIDEELSTIDVTFINTAPSSTNTNYIISAVNADDAGATGTIDALLMLNQADTNEAVEDGIKILASSGGLTTALDFDSTSIVTDIEFQNTETLHNNTDDLLTFTGVGGTNNAGFILDLDGATTATPTLRAAANDVIAIDDNLLVGVDGNITETLSNAGFVMDGDDFYVAGLAGVEGNIYTDGSLVVGSTTTYADGSITSSGTMTLDSSGTVQLGTDDDFLPQLGAGDADIGAVGTPWDNIYGVAGNFSGTLTVADITCTDCLDFTEFVDSMALDVSTTITSDAAEALTFVNNSTGNTIFNLQSTGDFVVQDNGSTFFTLSDSGAITGSATATSQLSTSTGTLTLSTTAGGTASSLILSSDDTSLDSINVDSQGGIDIDSYGTGGNGDIDIMADGGSIYLTTNDAANGTIYLDAQEDLWIVAQNDWMQIFASGGGIDMEAVEEIDMIAGQDGVSMSNFTPANNILTLTGGNFTDDVSRALFIDTNETLAADDLVLIQSNVGGADNNVFRIEGDGEAFSDIGFTAGAFSTNYYDGSIVSSGTMTIDSSGTVQLGTDDDLLPQLGAGDADIGASGTRWDNIFGVAGNYSGTVTAADFSCTDCLDFPEFEDTLDLDAALTLNQGTNTWTQNFTGTTTTGLTYNANSITSGTGWLFSADALTSGYGVRLDQTNSYGVLTTAAGELFQVDRNLTTTASTLTLNNSDVAAFTLTGTDAGGAFATNYQTNVVDIRQSLASSLGSALYVESDGTNAAVTINHDGDTSGTVTNDLGGALHIANTDNPGYAFTIFSANTAPSEPLVLLMTNQSTFDEPLLFLDQTGNDVSLFIEPSGDTGTTVSTLAGGALHINNASTGAAGNDNHAFTIYSNNDGDQASPLIYVKTDALTFDTPAFEIEHDGGAMGMSVEQGYSGFTAASVSVDQNIFAYRGFNMSAGTATLYDPMMELQSFQATTGTGVVTEDAGLKASILYLNQDYQATTKPAMYIDQESATADILIVETDHDGGDGADLPVLRIEADGEVFSHTGFTAGNFSTNYYDGEIQTSADLLLDIDGGDLTFDQATIIGDGGDILSIDSSDWDISISGSLTGIGNIVLDGILAHNPADRSGDTGLSGAWLTQTSGNYTDNVTAASGTAAAFSFNTFEQPTLAATNALVTTTDAATLYIENAPAAGANMTITNPYALWVDAGNARFDGTVTMNDISCTDCLDFTEFADTLALDAATTIGGDAGEQLIIARTFTDAVDEYGVSMAFFASDSTSSTTAQRGLTLENLGSTEGLDNVLRIVNEDVDDSVAAGIEIASAAGTILTGLNVSDAEIVDAINIGDNFFDTTSLRFFESVAGVITWEDTAGNDLMTLTDVGTTGDLDISGDFDVSGGDITSGTLAATNLFDQAGALTLDIGGVTADGGSIISVATNGTSADTISIGNSNSGTVVGLTGGDDWSITTAGVATFSDVACTDCLDFTELADSLSLDSATFITGTAGETISFLRTLTNATGEIGLDLVVTASDTTSGTLDQIGLSVENAPSTEGLDTIVRLSNVDTDDSVGNAIRIMSEGGAILTGIDFDSTNITTDIQFQNDETIDNDTDGTVAIKDGDSTVVASFSKTAAILNLSDTTTWTERLCHNGADAATGTVSVGDCSGTPGDLAEYYGSDGTLVPGELVVVSGDGSIVVNGGITTSKAYVERSSSSSQSKLIGVVSTDPNEVYAEGVFDPSENPIAVALVGRVPVKVNDSNGSIAVGDPITSSSTAGEGMKATKPGQIVGYALESWNSSGSSEIVVYVAPGWHSGTSISYDGIGLVFSETTILNSLGTATAVTPAYDSETLALRGSAWNGSAAENVEMKLVTDVSTTTDYHLSIKNTADTEVAYVTDDGTMAVSGDMIVTGKLYPSDQGVKQTNFYIYFDSSLGAGLEYMRTNAAGWSTGSYDFAEMFPSNDSLEAGDVVVFASESEHVRRSTSAYDTMAAGIVSTRPGFLAGEANPNDFPIALSGRVPTKVSLENGPIAVGDPLTTSSTPGQAMKATSPGPIVGYALEPYDGSQGDNLIITYVNVGYFGGISTDALAGTQNTASQVSFAGGNLSTLDMDGDIYMHANRIVDVGELRGVSGAWSIDGAGTIRTKSLVKNIIESYSGEEVETVAVTSPDVVITLTGTATLSEGGATITFEDFAPSFNDVTSTVAPIRVFVTPNGPVSLYVTAKNNNGFRVQELGGSSDGITFDWLVSAYRKDYEPVEALVVDVPEETPVGEPIVEEPTAEEPVAEEPAVNDPVVDTPVVDEPVVDEPAVEEPVVEPPTEEPVVGESVIEEPAPEVPAEEPLAGELVAEEPAV